MVRILLRGPLNVSEISEVLCLSQSNVSHSLRTLLEAGVVKRKGRGTWAYYSLNRLNPIVDSILNSVSSGMKEIENYENDMSELNYCYDKRRYRAKEFFDMVATRLDDVSHMMPDPDTYINDVINLYPAGSTILDAGCGNGELVVNLDLKGMAVIGVDQSREMLSNAGKRIASSSNARNVELRLGTAEHLPVADSSVDGVIAHMLLHHLSEPSEFFTEASRVCRDKGRCTVIDLTPHGDSDFKRIQGDLWPGFDRNEVRDWMSRAGFVLIEEIDSVDRRVFILSGVLKERNVNG